MAILNVLHYPDPRLRKKAETVAEIDDNIKKLVDDLFETMYDAPGVGLAATQVDVHLRIIVMDTSEEKNKPLCLINPEIIHLTGNMTMEEGCLSVPGIYEKVDRAEIVKVKALNKAGEAFELEADELLAVCIQHEIDHLEGKVFVDHLSRLKQDRILKKLEKQRRQAM